MSKFSKLRSLYLLILSTTLILAACGPDYSTAGSLPSWVQVEYSSRGYREPEVFCPFNNQLVVHYFLVFYITNDLNDYSYKFDATGFGFEYHQEFSGNIAFDLEHQATGQVISKNYPQELHFVLPVPSGSGKLILKLTVQKVWPSKDNVFSPAEKIFTKTLDISEMIYGCEIETSSDGEAESESYQPPYVPPAVVPPTTEPPNPDGIPIIYNATCLQGTTLMVVFEFPEPVTGLYEAQVDGIDFQYTPVPKELKRAYYIGSPPVYQGPVSVSLATIPDGTVVFEQQEYEFPACGVQRPKKDDGGGDGGYVPPSY